MVAVVPAEARDEGATAMPATGLGVLPEGEEHAWQNTRSTRIIKRTKKSMQAVLGQLD